MTEIKLQSQYIVPAGLLHVCAEQMHIDNVALSPLTKGFAKVLSVQDTPPRFSTSDVVCVMNANGTLQYYAVIPIQKVKRVEYQRRHIDCLGLPRKTYELLLHASIKEVGRLTQCTQTQLRTLPKCTPREARRIIVALQIRGLHLRKTPKKKKRRN